MTLITETSFSLLSELAKNNAKDWYDAHKDDIKTHCMTPFGAMLEHVSNRLVDSSYPLEGSGKSMMRMYRDVRFSKDKTPYKTTVSGMLTPDGSKSGAAGLVFVQMSGEGGWIAGGYYGLPTADLGLIRQRIVDKPDAYHSLLEGLKADGLGLEDMHRLTRMPKGFTDHEDSIHAPDIKLKSFIVRRDVPKAAWLNGDVTGDVADLARSVTPLLQFGRDALKGRA